MMVNFIKISLLILINFGLLIGIPFILWYCFGYVQSDAYLNENTKFRIKHCVEKDGKNYYMIKWKRFYHWHSVWDDDEWGDSYQVTYKNEEDAIKALNEILKKILLYSKHLENNTAYTNTICAKDLIYGKKD